MSTDEPIIASLDNFGVGYHVAGQGQYQVAHVRHTPHRPAQGQMKRDTDPLLSVTITRDFLLRDLAPEEADEIDAWLAELARDITIQLGARIAKLAGRPLVFQYPPSVSNW